MYKKMIVYQTYNRLYTLVFIPEFIIYKIEKEKSPWYNGKSGGCNLIVNKFKLESCHYIHFWISYPWKRYHHHHHHHVVPPARISLTLSRHFSLLFIASGTSSGLHPVSSHSCCM